MQHAPSFLWCSTELSVPRCSDVWQSCAPSWQRFCSSVLQGALLALLTLWSMGLAARFFHTRGNKRWNAGSSRCIGGAGRSGLAFCWLLANPIMEMSSRVAGWLQVGTCTHVHTDPFKDEYPRLALPAGLLEMSEGWAPIGVAVSWELESISDAAQLLMPDLFPCLFCFSSVFHLPFLFLRMMENVPPMKHPFGISLDQLTSNF